MGVIDELVKANEEFYRTFTLGMLPAHPSREVAIVACMDARMDVEAILGLQPGEAHVIRNAGGIVTEDAIRSLILSTGLLGTKEIMIINHTDCGTATFRDDEVRARLIRETGATMVSPACFHAFTDVEDNVREQVAKVRSHPWVPKGTVVRGFVYDVRTGRLAEVTVR